MSAAPTLRSGFATARSTMSASSRAAFGSPVRACSIRSARSVILSAAVLIRLRVEPQPELTLPIAVALLGDVHDHGRLLSQLLQLRLRRSVAAIARFSRNADLVFELSVAPDTEDIRCIG